jgi:hypothetical protein
VKDKQSQPARGTHPLSRVEGETSEDTERKSASEGTHFLLRDKSRCQRKANEQGALTNCQRSRETSEDTERKSVSEGTHFLLRVEGETSEDIERKSASEWHPPPVNGRGGLSQRSL